VFDVKLTCTGVNRMDCCIPGDRQSRHEIENEMTTMRMKVNRKEDIINPITIINCNIVKIMLGKVGWSKDSIENDIPVLRNVVGRATIF